MQRRESGSANYVSAKSGLAGIWPRSFCNGSSDNDGFVVSTATETSARSLVHVAALRAQFGHRFTIPDEGLQTPTNLASMDANGLLAGDRRDCCGHRRGATIPRGPIEANSLYVPRSA